ncbi:hypothetical protein [Mucilaginibacter sp. L196]|uniref:hypothetical protein n=1 Tax=Mucilaginibacter sp. L196 TaxID=1641870 RepID=UPI00131EAE98|nr:hypothetical protein [Mucilaginibacter sp. L196]
MQPLKNITSNIKEYGRGLSEDGFHQLFNHIDQFKIKEGVDRLGLDKFIDQCAYLAAGSGVISGGGGVFTMIIGMPFDFINLITQQFRVTMAIMYRNRGTYRIGFDEFMALVATSLKVEASVTITKTMMESVAEKMLMIFGTRTAERLIPLVGATIGGTTNYLFIKRMAKMVKKMQLEPAVIQVF